MQMIVMGSPLCRKVQTSMKTFKLTTILLLLAALLCAAGCSADKDSQEPQQNSQVATADQMTTIEDVVEKDMVPIYGDALKDGVYSITVDSSYSMFKITDCELTVQNGQMTAVLYMGGTGYTKVFMGTGEEATQAQEADYIPYVETADGIHTYTVPVEALDMGISCTAFSKSKELWYDRTLVFRADSLPLDAFQDSAIITADSLQLADGTYTVDVQLEGGSGKASVQSPAQLRIENGAAYATIIWSSSNYDYMKVDEIQYLPLNTEGNSTFEIPVAAFDRKLPVLADTTAMSTPHEIQYTLYFDAATIESAP